MPWWEDTPPALSPDGGTWPTPTTTMSGSSPRRAARRAGSSREGSPRGSTTRRLADQRRARRRPTTRLAVVDVDDPWPRRLAGAHGELDAHGDEGERRAVARRDRGGLHVHAQGRYEPKQRDPRGLGRRWRRAPVHRRAGHARRRTGVVARRPDDCVRIRAQRLLRAPPRGTRRRGRPAAHERGRRSPRARLASGRHPDRGLEGPPQPLQPRFGGRRRRQRGGAGRRRHLVRAALDRGRAISSATTRITRRRASSASSCPDATPPPSTRRPRKAVRTRPARGAQDITYESFDGLEIPAS